MDDWYDSEPNPVDELPEDVIHELQKQCSSEKELIERARAILAAQDEDAMRENLFNNN